MVWKFRYIKNLRAGKECDSDSCRISCYMIDFYFCFGGDILKLFFRSNEDILFLMFLGKYQYADVNDLKYLFCSGEYYKKRITKLVKNNIIIRSKHHIILSKKGSEFLKEYGATCNRVNRNAKYSKRLLFLSKFAAFFYRSKFVKFIPSFEIKDDEHLTLLSRRYIGVTIINSIEYLTYYISKEHTQRYMSSVIYDIQKEKSYNNIIVFYETGVNINPLNFTFGHNQVLIIEDTLENKNNLQYIHCIDWYEILYKYFKEPFISQYSFCDYEDLKGSYISYFTFYDTEKVNRINQYLLQNKIKKVDIVCSKQLYERLLHVIPRANYLTLDLEKFIDRKRYCYE